MEIYVDNLGTLTGNVAGHTDAACAEAVLTMLARGHAAQVCSAFPGPGMLDKFGALRGDIRGKAFVDDDEGVLQLVRDRGGIAVRASELLRFAAELPEVQR